MSWISLNVNTGACTTQDDNFFSHYNRVEIKGQIKSIKIVKNIEHDVEHTIISFQQSFGDSKPKYIEINNDIQVISNGQELLLNKIPCKFNPTFISIDYTLSEYTYKIAERRLELTFINIE